MVGVKIRSYVKYLHRAVVANTGAVSPKNTGVSRLAQLVARLIHVLTARRRIDAVVSVASRSHW